MISIQHSLNEKICLPDKYEATDEDQEDEAKNSAKYDTNNGSGRALLYFNCKMITHDKLTAYIKVAQYSS